MNLLLALTIVTTASPNLEPAERFWLPFYRATAGEADVLSSLGKPAEIDAMTGGGKLLTCRPTAVFPGGVDAWLDEKGQASDLTFYFVPLGRVWTLAAKQKASRIVSRASLDDVVRRYGPPSADKKGKGRRMGVRRLIYQEPSGSATKSVTFGSVPFTNGLHTITVSWE